MGCTRKGMHEGKCESAGYWLPVFVLLQLPITNMQVPSGGLGSADV